jgi:2'-5' RNA ligase
MPRLFVAVWPDPATMAALSRVPRDPQGGVRWTSPAQWHVTLRFFGNADEHAAREALGEVRHAPVDATIDGPIRRLGRQVIAVTVAGLETLAAEVTRATAHIGAPPEPRPFSGHITLARLRGAPRCAVLGHRVRATWPVVEIALVRSDTRPSGAVYETLAVHRLAPRATP